MLSYLTITCLLGFSYSQDLTFQEVAMPKDRTAQHGDVIFQTSLSNQSQAIQLATHSAYSHVGIVYEIDNELYVLEAVQTVQLTPIGSWMIRGKDAHFVVKRLKNAKELLTEEVLLDIDSLSKTYLGKNYDLYFNWSDEQMYCSELVWKIYKQATGVELGTLAQLSSFDLNNDLVQKKMKERYGDKVPLDEWVISPAAIFNSDELIEVLTF